MSPAEPAWYPDPQDRTLVRWWDGQAWTGHAARADRDQPQTGTGATPRKMTRKTKVVIAVVVALAAFVPVTVVAYSGLFLATSFQSAQGDDNATSDLQRVAASKEYYIAANGVAAPRLEDLATGGASFTQSLGVEIRMTASGQDWIASTQHAGSDTVFYASSTHGQPEGRAAADGVEGLPDVSALGLNWSQVQP